MKSILMILLLITTLFQVPLSSHAEGQRSRSLNFEDDLIEGINRKPLDSFNQISDPNHHKASHLYQKRSGFADRNQSLLPTLGWLK